MRSSGRKPVAYMLLLCTAGVAMACGQSTPTQVTAEPDPEPEPTPRDTTPLQGLDRARLYRLVDQLRVGRHGEVHSLLILRNGETVIEEYFQGFHSYDEHSLQSVSKSFTSALIGIAIANAVSNDPVNPGDFWIGTWNALSGAFFLAAVVYGNVAYRDMDPVAQLIGDEHPGQVPAAA